MKRETSPKEKELLLRAKQGNVSAFEQIVFLYEKPIFRHIYRFTGHVQDAEDLTQETFLKLYKSIGKVDPDKEFRFFAYTVATNTAYDWLRKKRRAAELFFADDSEPVLEAAGHTNSKALEKNFHLTHDLTAAMERLAPIAKTILLLFYADGFSYREIAAILSMPFDTVKTHIWRSRQELKKELA